MDRNEFWALTGSSMSPSIQEENPVTVSRKDVEGDYLSLKKEIFLLCSLSMTEEGLLGNSNSLKVVNVNG